MIRSLKWLKNVFFLYNEFILSISLTVVLYAYTVLGYYSLCLTNLRSRVSILKCLQLVFTLMGLHLLWLSVAYFLIDSQGQLMWEILFEFHAMSVYLWFFHVSRFAWMWNLSLTFSLLSYISYLNIILSSGINWYHKKI